MVTKKEPRGSPPGFGFRITAAEAHWGASCAGPQHPGGRERRGDGQAGGHLATHPVTACRLPALAVLVGKLRLRDGKPSAQLLASPETEVGAENWETFLFPAQPHSNQLGGRAGPSPSRSFSSRHPSALPACFLATPMDELISGWFAEAKPLINKHRGLLPLRA